MTADKIEMDVSREEALKSALLNIFYTETIGHCHVDEAVEHLALLPSRTVGPVLSQVRLIAHSVSDLLAFTLIENAQKALRHLSLKQLGDWVEEGEIIADAGSTGWVNKVTLYFEIRDKGKPVNPKRWCHR